MTTTVGEDGSVTVSIPMRGGDLDAMSYTTTKPQHGIVTGSGPVFVYHPGNDFTGADSFRVMISDGDKTVIVPVFIQVGAVNDPPVAVDDAFTTQEDTPLVFPTSAVLANDHDVDSPHLVVTAASQPSVCAAKFGCGQPAVTLANDMITYRPPHNFHGVQSFQYTVSDGQLTAVGTVTVTVTSVNDAPVANDDWAQGSEDTALVIPMADLLGNDYDVDDETPMVVAATGPTHGSVAIDGTTVVFTPDADYNGDCGFDYTISDGALTASAHVAIAILPVNDAPVAHDDSVDGSEDTALVIPMAALLSNDTDVDHDTLSVTDATNPTHGSVALDGTTVVFTPDADYNGDAGFDYTISDGALTASAHVALSIAAVDDAPVAQATSATVDENSSVDIGMTATDVDSTDFTFAVETSPANGTLTVTGSTFTYTPDADFFGSDWFAFTASDGAKTSAAAVVTVTVNQVNTCTMVPETPSTCAHDIHNTGSALTNGCNQCVTTVCAGDPFCCQFGWDGLCKLEVSWWCECAPQLGGAP